MNTERFVQDSGGVVGLTDLADYLDISVNTLRDWAVDYGVAMVGNAFAFDVEAALEAEEDLVECDDDDEDEDENECEDDGRPALAVGILATEENTSEDGDEDEDDEDDDDDDEY